jgi:diguanylate cyclase (GGDEF)-like protein
VKVILATMLVSVAFGYAGGGRLTNLGKIRILLAPLAIVGLALQMVVPPGPWPLVLLIVSFGMLLAFGIVNRRVPGFRLILVGTVLNLLVIGVNQGMPVARRALIDSGQQDTLTELVHEGGAKHHLAGADDHLLFLGDVIAIPPPIGQIVSLGDVLTFGGVAWLIVVGMLGPAWVNRRRRWWWIRSRDGDEGDTGDDSEADPSDSPHDRRASLRWMEAAVVVPFGVWLAVEVARDPRQFLDWRVLVWASAIAIIDLLPVTASSDLAFSLSFPVELTAALLYFPPVAALIAFLGAFDTRELRGELPPMKALYIRGQIAFSVATESLVFHTLTSLHARWFVIGPTVMLAAFAGYAVNVLVVATYAHLQRSEPIRRILLEMHVGVFGEFVISYMGLALFSVLVAISTETIGLWALVVFIAPLAFARQMFQRTHSLEVATNELAARQAENEHQALHDALTGLPNRVLFHQHLIEAIDAIRGPNDSLAVMLMDLDHFKEINDTLGHHFGDMLLKQIGPRLSSVLREGDVMARLGGDEFGVLLPDLPSPETVLTIVHRLLSALEEPVAVEGLALGISGSIGIALFPEHSTDAESLLRRADVAMYASKESGGGYEFYHEDLDRHSPAQLELIGSVRPALEAGEFVLYYQPKVRFSDGAVAGAEALIRWQHPKLGLLMPDAFIPFVERTVLLRPLTQYVVNEALRQWREWADLGTRLEVAVNVSPRSLLDQQLPSQIAAALETWGVPPEFLKLELTESFLMSDSGRSTAVLDELSRIGVGLSIDDFGTGYSSLSHLKRLPIQEIKIDRSFVMNMLRDPNDAMIVRATVELGQNLGMRVVAEGVEDRETWDLLESFGCDEAQGYFFSPPLQRDEFRRWASVRTGMPLPALERGLSLG